MTKPLIQPNEVLFENATYDEFVEVIKPLLEAGRAALRDGGDRAAWAEYHKVSAILSLVNSVRDSTQFPGSAERPQSLRVVTGEMFIEYRDASLEHGVDDDTTAVVDVTGYPEIESLRFTHVPQANW